MVNGLPARAAMQVARVFRDGTLSGMSDRQVLERFIAHRDETAFEAILYRHGAMVRNVCKQMLFDPHDVDDAVQAVFLVLVRKAKFIRIEGSLGPWLYAVAGRVAARARAKRRTRWARECQSRETPEASYSSTEDACEIPRVIHDELGRLPERLRAPLVLCYLEGLTHDLAARQLDCPVGTVRSRLARARILLHRRITRRGITLSAAGLGALLESNAKAGVSSRLPATLVESITCASLKTVLQTGIGLSTSLATILEGAMSVSHFKKIAILATVISVGGIATAVVGRTTVGQTAVQESQASQVSNGPGSLDLNRRPPEVNDKPETKKDPRVQAIESKLDETISFNIYEQPLSGAVGFLQSYTGLNIVLDPKALSEAGLTSSSPVTLSIKQVKLRTALKLLLKPLGLAYKLEDEVVLITGPGAAATSDKAPYPKTYYVGDLLIKPSTQKQTGTTPAAGVQSKIDMMPLIDLIEFSVAPGKWQVQDGYGNVVPSKKSTRAVAPGDQRNSIVPFFLSISLIIKCPEDVHDDIAHLLRCLRRLQDGPWGDAEEGRHVLLPNPQRPADRGTANPGTQAETDRRNKLMKELNGVLNASGSPGEPEASGNKRTKVAAIPDVDVLVSESKRVIGVSETTLFEIRLANYGNKPATNLQLAANLSSNLEVVSVAGMQNDLNVLTDESKHALRFSQINKLEPGTVMVFGFHVKAVGETPKLATCEVVVTYDQLSGTIGDMAGVKVKTRVPAALESFDRNIR
jgi:RNA polymerase sigma factor (sigma-70 family)